MSDLTKLCCPECGADVIDTLHGIVCLNGHGGIEPVPRYELPFEKERKHLKKIGIHNQLLNEFLTKDLLIPALHQCTDEISACKFRIEYLRTLSKQLKMEAQCRETLSDADQGS